MDNLTTYREALKKASGTIEELLGEVERLKRREPVAIVGMGCRLPGGADSPEAFWRLLREGRDAVGTVPRERWSAERYFDPAGGAGKMYLKEGGFLAGSPYDFDPRFFGISPKEALALDPQQRLLLEVSWEALEDAGIDPALLKGSRTGVFVGISSDDYQCAHLRSGDPSLIDPYSLTGFTFSTAAGRISYTLGLEGPSIPVDTACSSSLVALHLACRSLREGECDLALVGGVNLMLTPEPLIAFCQLHALSPDGRCKTFDAGADGYGRGEGCGVIVLKRLELARRDKDRVLALVKGSALNNDGRSNGLTAPNGLAQKRVILSALEDAGLLPGDVDYVEAHGTGTPLGDPIEAEAIAAALCPGRTPSTPLLVGSAKTNIGHLEAAAGVAGIIKLVLALNREEIPPQLHFRSPSPHIPWGELPLKVVTRGTPWPRGSRPRTAGISGFGFSGTNAHILLAEAPLAEQQERADGRSDHLLLLSAADEGALRALAGRYAQFLQSPSPPALPAICHSAAVGRNRFPHLLAVSGSAHDAIAAKLAAYASGGGGAGIHLAAVKAPRRDPVFVFTGQGSQYPGMGKELYQTSPVYREALDLCDSLFAPLLKLSIREMMHTGLEEELSRTVCTQPAIFALEYSLCRLWQSWGVRPSALLGHSIGELVAACVAGVLSLPDAVTLVAHRGRLMNELPEGGGMAAVLCPEEKLLPLLSPFAGRVCVAAVNAPETVVLSGEKQAVAAALEAVQRETGASFQYLTVSHAFHSHLMDPALDEFERIAATLAYHPPAIPVISNVTGSAAAGDELRTPSYWRRHLRSAVRFGDAVACLRDRGSDLFLEIGASATLSSFVRRVAPQARLAASLKRGVPAWSTLTASLGELCAAGVEIDWRGYDAPYRSPKVPLPLYPFQRQRFFMNPVREGGTTRAATAPEEAAHPLLGARLDSPSREERYVKEIRLSGEPWLEGHRILDAVLMPAAGYLESALALVSGRFPGGTTIEGAEFQAPLVLSPGSRRLETLYDPDQGSISVHSKGAEGGWQRHATLLVRRGPEQGGASRAEAPFPGEGGGTLRSGEEFYADLESRGYRYGGVFRGIRSLCVDGASARARVEVPAEAAAGFVLHPALLDGCLTLAGACLLYGDDPLPEGAVMVPAAVERLSFSGGVATSLEVRCTQRERSRVRAVYDLVAATPEGNPVLEISALVLRRMRREQLAPGAEASRDGLLYRLAWREAPAPQVPARLDGRWLVAASDSAFSRSVCAALKDAAEELTVIDLPAHARAGADPAPAPDACGARDGRTGNSAFDKAHPAPALVTEADRAEELARRVKGGLTGVVSLLDSPAAALRLVQTIISAGTTPRLHLVTSTAWDPSGMEREIDPAAGALWGLGATVAAEAPTLCCRLLDLSGRPGSEELSSLLRELSGAGAEDRVALRGGRRFVPRLVTDAPPAERESLQLPNEDGFRLDVEQRGSLEGLNAVVSPRRAQGEGEVEVRVRASGLNFRDVLNVLGRYPGDPGLLGFECCGVVSRTGSDPGGYSVGDRVFVFNSDGCFADYRTVPRAHLVRMPDGLGFEEAATIPVAFLTAWYGLHHLARIGTGERVLIHAAAGGVGLAALQLCRAAGARVFATAGSEEKRELLLRMGAERVFDSRSLGFAAGVREAAEGGTVDVVLNSLGPEFIEAGLSLLAPGGRFVEIGKADLRSEEEIRQLHPGIRYHRFDLAALSALDPAGTADTFRALLRRFEAGELSPLPMTVFQAAQARDAFRFLAQARNVGKVVISFADRVRERRTAERGAIDPEGSYLVTGGLGALGLAVARWLSEQGCRHLVLTGRTAPDPEACALLEELRRMGAEPLLIQADVADPDQVAALMERVRETLPPLRGIFHAAGVLEDAMLPELDQARLDLALAPKLTGAWNLHRATEKDDLELFVLFSSLTALTGSPGQANYSAANAALDAFARWRRKRGLAALSIQWGPWGDAGMAAADGRGERLAARGVRSLSSADALRALAAALRDNPVERCVADLDPRLLAAFVPSAGAGFYAELATVAAAPDAADGEDALTALAKAPPEERPELLLRLVRELAARVMGLGDPSGMEIDRPLQEQGFDSLMAVDLRNLLAKTLGRDLPVSLLFDYPTLEKMARYLQDQLLDPAPAGGAGAERGAAPAAGPVAGEKSADDLVDEIEQLLAL